MRFDPRILRTGLIWLVIVVATAIAGLAALFETGVLTPTLLARVNERLEREGGLQLEAASLYFRPWSGLSLRDVWVTVPSAAGRPAAADSAAVPAWSGAPRNHLLSVGEIDVGYRVLGLLAPTPSLRRIKLVRPDLDLAELERWRDARAAAADPDDGGRGSGRGTGRGLRVDELRILEGRLEAAGGTVLSGLRLVGRVDTREGAVRLRIDDAGGHLAAPRIDEDLQLTGTVAFDGDGIDVEGLHLGVADGRLSLAGRVDPDGSGPTALTAQGYALSLRRAGSWLGLEHPLLDADLGFRLVATGRPDSLELRGSFRGTSADGSVRDIRLLGVRRGDVLDLDTLHLSAGGSRLDLSGRIRLGETPSLDANVVFRDLDLATLLADPDFAPVTDLDGDAHVVGTGLTRATFSGAADVRVTAARLFGLPVDSVVLHPRMERGELLLESATFRRGGTVVTGVGSIDAEDRVAVELDGTVADLADLGEAFGEAAAAVEGQATVEVRLLGPLSRPDLEAILRFEDVGVLGTTARTLELRATSTLAGAETEFAIDATGRGIGWGGREIPRAVASGVLRPGGVGIRSLRLESERNGALRLAGDLSVAGDTLAGTVHQLELVPPDAGPVWGNAGDIRIERSDGVLRLTGVDLRGAGRVRADVSVDRDRAAWVQATGERVDLAAFSPFLPAASPVSGTLDFDVDARLGADTLAADVDLDLVDGAFGDLPVESLRGRLSILEREATIRSLELVTAQGKATVEGSLAVVEGSFRDALGDSAVRAELPERLEARGLAVRVESPDWTWFWDLTPWPDMDGHGMVVLGIDGPATRPTVDLWAHLADGRLGREPLDELSGTARLENDRLAVRDAWVNTGAGRIRAEGSLPVAWGARQPGPALVRGEPYDLALAGEALPVGALTGFVPLLEMGTGTADADLRLVGRPDSARFDGGFTIADATITIPDFADPLVDGDVAGRFVPDGIEIASARFGDGRGGRVDARGTVSLRNLSAVDWRLEIEASGAHYRGLVNGIRGTGSGSLVLDAARPPDAASDATPLARFTGAFEVEQAAMDERVLLPPSAARAMPTMPEGVQGPEPLEAEGDVAGPDEEAPPAVLARIEFRADDNVWLRTAEIQVELAGEVTLVANPRWVGLGGEMRTRQGTYVVLNTEFDIDRAEIRFVDPSDPTVANLDAEASTRVLDEEVTAVVTGTLAVPEIRLSTESGMTEREIFELLALRRKPGEAPPPGQESDVVSNELVSSWTTVLANRFGREIGQEIGLDTFDVERDEVATSLGLGKSLGSNFFLRYRQQVDTDENVTDEDILRERLETPERQLLLEYRLSEIFQLQGETGTIQGDGYLNVDLKAEWGY